jgi:general nucleoside transport system permease protein
VPVGPPFLPVADSVAAPPAPPVVAPMVAAATAPIWAPLVGFPLEWAALALLAAGAIYWERAALSGIGIEGCVLSAMLGFCLGYEWSGSYAIAAGAGAAGAILFALVTSVLLLSLRSDPAIGSFCLSLVPAVALGLYARAVPLRLLHETPAPGLIPGTMVAGTYAEDLIANPWFLAAPVLLLLAGFAMLRTPYGLRLRAYSETPALARSRPWQVVWSRVTGAMLGSLWAVPAAAIELRAHPGSPPIGLGAIALACAIAGRWGFLPAILLAAGPALLRSLRPYAPAPDAPGIALEAAPFVLAILYLVLFSRRSLRAATTRQSRLDPDVL